MSGDFRGACLVFRMPPKMAARGGLPTTLRRSILGVSLLRAQGLCKISHGRLCKDWITRPADRRSVPDWIAGLGKWRTLTASACRVGARVFKPYQRGFVGGVGALFGVSDRFGSGKQRGCARGLGHAV